MHLGVRGNIYKVSLVPHLVLNQVSACLLRSFLVSCGSASALESVYVCVSMYVSVYHLV